MGMCMCVCLGQIPAQTLGEHNLFVDSCPNRITNLHTQNFLPDCLKRGEMNQQPAR